MSIINTKAVVEHDSKISDFVHISPSATLTGAVTIGEGTHIGAGAVMIPNVQIDEWSVIGAGAPLFIIFRPIARQLVFQQRLYEKKLIGGV